MEKFGVTSGISTSHKSPLVARGQKRVFFSPSDEVRIFEPDLKHDDEEFIRVGNQLAKAANEETQRKSKFSWLPQFLSSPSEVKQMDEQKLERFKDAFEYRLRDLPELRRGRNVKVDNVIRDLSKIVHLAEWHVASNDKENTSRHRSNIENFCDPFPRQSQGDFYSTKIEHKRNEVDLFAQSVRNRLSKNMSAETLLSEIKNLSEISRSTTRKDIREYCTKEIKTMEYMLEDMGYTRGHGYY